MGKECTTKENLYILKQHLVADSLLNNNQKLSRSVLTSIMLKFLSAKFTTTIYN